MRMEKFAVGEIVNAARGRLVKGEPCSLVSDISTDSRTLKRDDFFVALAGERFDGHDFIPQALERRAAGLVVSRDIGDLPVRNIIIVEDTMQALGDIARTYRSKFDIPVVGITGSNGKTTTKDMTASVLSQKYSILKNEGNLNNAIGVPLTLFRISEAHQIAVIEMGVGAPGEMSRLVEIAQPDVAVVTNVGPTHLEFFGSVDNIAAEKGLLVRSASSAVLNGDDPRVANMRDTAYGRTILFGLAEDGTTTGTRLRKDVLAAEIGQDLHGKPVFTLVTNAGETRIHLPSLGRHNVYNALAAASVGILFNVCLDEVGEALESYKTTPMRMQEEVVDDVVIINDAYNSNPVSLKAAMDFLSEMECAGRKIALLGDMLELGDQSEELHREAGCSIADRKIHILVTVGDKASKIAESALNCGFPEDRVLICETNMDAAEHLRSILRGGDIVLIKGSRRMSMEKIIEAIRKSGFRKSQNHVLLS